MYLKYTGSCCYNTINLIALFAILKKLHSLHASVHGAAPVYIQNMLTSVTELPGRLHLRSAASGLYDVPRTRTTRSFSVAGPTAWNALPLELCANTDSVCFRKKTENFSFFSSRFMVLTLIHAN